MKTLPLVTAEEVRSIEEAAFAAGVTAETLMEEAGCGIADTVEMFFPNTGTFEAHFGKGHNGGDILVAACYLAERGWRIVERPACPEEQLAPLTAKCLARLRSVEQYPARRLKDTLVIGDGLLGIGTRGMPRDEIARAIATINTARNERHAWVISADIPSGLDADTGAATGDCVTADCTATIGFAKKGLIADTAINFVGRLVLIPLDELKGGRELLAPAKAKQTSRKNEGIEGAKSSRPPLTPSAEHLITSAPMPVLPFDRHKGDAGRVSLVAGSMRYVGAARLAAAAAVRGGAGLVTLFVPPELAPILAASCMPEVMIFPTNDIREVLHHPADTIAIGPGLGRDSDLHVTHIIAEASVPLVVDADALNALAETPARLLRRANRSDAPRILTPHPGEMERLYPRNGRTRCDWARDFATTYLTPADTLILKGARSIIAASDGTLFYNTTGNPGMATGGMGDVLTGVTAAFLAQKIPPLEAAKNAVYLCGRAAEIATIYAQSPESLCASDVVSHLGLAMR